MKKTTEKTGKAPMLTPDQQAAAGSKPAAVEVPKGIVEDDQAHAAANNAPAPKGKGKGKGK